MKVDRVLGDMDASCKKDSISELVDLTFGDSDKDMFDYFESRPSVERVKGELSGKGKEWDLQSYPQNKLASKENVGYLPFQVSPMRAPFH